MNLPRWLTTYLVFWAGQTCSFVGSGVTGFALGIWVFQKTHSVTQFAMVMLWASIPTLIALPFGGAAIDRFGTKAALMFSDIGGGVSIAVMMASLYFFPDSLIGIYAAVALSALFRSIHPAAMNKATTQLVPADNLGRISGLLSLGGAISTIISPLLGGTLIALLDLHVILWIDLASYLVSIFTLLRIKLPHTSPQSACATGPQTAVTTLTTLAQDVRQGLAYVQEHRGLKALLILYGAFNLFGAMCNVLISPLILSFASPAALGTVTALAGLGLLGGSLVMTAWGGPKRKIYGITGTLVVLGLATIGVGLRESIWLISICAIGGYFFVPILGACERMLMQTIVPIDIQGRVFSIDNIISMSLVPLAAIITGPLAEHLFKPLLQPTSLLAATAVSQIFGTGSNRGIGLLYSLVGVAMIAVTAIALTYRPLRTLGQTPSTTMPERAYENL